MKKLYYIYTNGYDMIISDDGNVRRAYTFVDNKGLSYAEVLDSVEDDSSWEVYEESVEELAKHSKILAEKEW